MNPQASVKIPLTKGAFALASLNDAPMLLKFKWHLTNRGYAARLQWRGSGKSQACIYMHRVIAGTPDGMETDHINGDRLDNRRSNLRVCTHGENCKNMRLSRANKTGFRGVDKHSQNGNYRAQIMSDGKLIHVGCFSTPEEAGAAYAAASVKLHGKFSNQNQTPPCQLH